MRRGRTQRSGVEGLHGRIHARRGRRAAKGRETAPVRTLLSRPIALGTATDLAGRRETVNGAPAASIVTRARSTRTRRRPRTSIGGARSSHGNRRLAIGSGRRARRQTRRLARRSGFDQNTAKAGLPRRSGSSQNTAKAGSAMRSALVRNVTVVIGHHAVTRFGDRLTLIGPDLRVRTGATSLPGRLRRSGSNQNTAGPGLPRRSGLSQNTAAVGLPRRSGSNQNTAKAGLPRRSGSNQNDAEAGRPTGVGP